MQKAKEISIVQSSKQFFSLSFPYSAILGYLCTGREFYQFLSLRYMDHSGTPESVSGRENWLSILSASLVSKRFRELCLESIFGTVVLRKMKKIGQLWKLLEVNPRLGSFTHTCHLEYHCRLVDQYNYPSQVMPMIFTSRVDSINERVEAAQSEAEWKRRWREKNPADEWESDEQPHDAEFEISGLKQYATVGPDNNRIDENIKNPSDLREALTFVFSRWTRLQRLHWESYQIPLFTSVISSIAAHQSLKRFKINLAACDEDFFANSTGLSPTRESSFIFPDPL